MPQIISFMSLVLPLLFGFRMPGALLAGCLFTYQAGAISGYSWLGSAYVAIAAAMSVVRFISKPVRLKLTLADASMLALTSYLMTSTAWAPNSNDAVAMAIQLMLSVVGMYIIARLQSDDPRKLILEFVISSVVLGMVLGLCALGSRVVDNAHESTRLVIANESASTVGLSMPLPYAMLMAVMAIFFAPKKWMSITGTISLTIVSYAAVISATRSVFLAAVVGIIVTLFLGKRFVSMQRYAMVGVMLIVGSAALLAYLPQENIANLISRFGGNGSKEVGEDASSIQRRLLWADSWNMFSSEPLLGTGFGSFSAYSFGPYPHNMILEIASTSGLVGTVLLAIWLICLGGLLWSGYRRHPLSGSLLIGFTAVALVQMQVSFAFFMARPLFLVSALAPMLARGGGWRKPKRETRLRAKSEHLLKGDFNSTSESFSQ